MMDDLISRQASIDELVRWGKIPDYNDGERNMIACCIAMLSALPPAQPSVSKTEIVGDVISKHSLEEIRHSICDGDLTNAIKDSLSSDIDRCSVTIDQLFADVYEVDDDETEQ